MNISDIPEIGHTALGAMAGGIALRSRAVYLYAGMTTHE